MNYRAAEKARSQEVLSDVIRAEGNGLFGGRPYEFVLKQAELNLWDGIREDALEYFGRNSIAWWRSGEEKGPTGHLFSSQVACLNHLYWMRTRKDAALAVARNLHPGIVDMDIMDDGYMEFEVVGAENYLGEKSHSRGANATSVDAALIGKKADGNNLLIIVEWKYTEQYGPTCLYKPARAEIYDAHLEDSRCPIQVDDKSALYYEPYYQLMRQTLLAWKMAEAREYGADEYLHVHVIPKENSELLDVNTSPRLKGSNLEEAWKKVLKSPDRYIIMDPRDLLAPVAMLPETKSVLTYLEGRYWRGLPGDLEDPGC